MFSISSLATFAIGFVLLYFLWKILKTAFVVAGFSLVVVGALIWWAHTEDMPPDSAHTENTATQQKTLIENGARWLAGPLHNAAETVARLTEDKDGFAQHVSQTSQPVQEWVQKTQKGLPPHILQSTKSIEKQKSSRITLSTP